MDQKLFSEALQPGDFSRKIYEYKKLENEHSTRLLKVGEAKLQYHDRVSVPDAAGWRVQYEIVEVDLENLPEYETTSYAWGSLDKKFFIRLGDHGILLITESLATALPRLIQCCTAKYLWIDQICKTG
jgi:hypothetical protein